MKHYLYRVLFFTLIDAVSRFGDRISTLCCDPRFFTKN